MVTFQSVLYHPLLISDIWALWHSALSARVPERQETKQLTPLPFNGLTVLLPFFLYASHCTAHYLISGVCVMHELTVLLITLLLVTLVIFFRIFYENACMLQYLFVVDCES